MTSSDQINFLYHHATRLWLNAQKASRHAPCAAPPFAMALFTDERLRTPHQSIQKLPPPNHAPIAVIFRHYQTADRARLAQELATLTHEQGHLFLVSGDSALAEKVNADGLHLPEWQLDDTAQTTRARSAGILSAACHSAQALQKAEKAGADCAFLSPVFATKSHEGAPALGIQSFTQLAAKTALPVLALGGIDQHTVQNLEKTPAAGFGAISAFEV